MRQAGEIACLRMKTFQEPCSTVAADEGKDLGTAAGKQLEIQQTDDKRIAGNSKSEARISQLLRSANWRNIRNLFRYRRLCAASARLLRRDPVVDATA